MQYRSNYAFLIQYNTVPFGLWTAPELFQKAFYLYIPTIRVLW